MLGFPLFGVFKFVRKLVLRLKFGVLGTLVSSFFGSRA